MLKQTITAAILASLLSACVTTQSDPSGSIAIDAESFNASLQVQQAALVESIKTECKIQADGLAILSEKVDVVTDQITNMNSSTKQKTQAVPVQCQPSPLGDKFLLGEVESVHIDELNTTFATRIDTGAESSSLDARNLVLFERDSVQWVKFDVHIQGVDSPPQSFEAKVVRFVRIKQDANESDDRRPVIHAHLKIGKYAAETDLNLTDRSHLDYPLLLGRKFMKDIAVVDVSQSFIHGKAKNLVTSSGQ